MSRLDRTWRIGELARETGLTVRTLHHYDQLGLLSPPARTEGGHRCYASSDVRRLHRIVALRSLGISLEQVGTLLDGDLRHAVTTSCAASAKARTRAVAPPARHIRIHWTDGAFRKGT